MPRWQLIPQENWARARQLRQNLTPAELLLWRALQATPLSVRVRRQQPVGPYIVDFLISKCKLVIELDGEIHATEEQREHDRKRDEYFARRGYEVMRFSNEEVMTNVEAIVAEIVKKIIPPCPPAKAGG